MLFEQELEETIKDLKSQLTIKDLMPPEETTKALMTGTAIDCKDLMPKP